MRAKGEGTIQSLPNGKYRGLLSIDGRRLTGPTVDKRAEALPAAREKAARLAKEASPDQPSLSTCVALKIASSSYSPTTIDLWSAFKNRLGILADLKPSEIETSDVDAWLANQSGGDRTRRNYATLLRQVLTEYSSPGKVTLPRARRKKPRILTKPEQAELLALPMRGEVRTMVFLALRMGLRRSEIAGLHHKDRDEDGVMIRRAVVRAAGTIALKDTKTSGSEAWVPLCAELLDEVGSGEGFVLGGDSRPLSPSTLDDRWRRLIKGTRFQGVGLHDLRRSFGMGLLEKGTDVRTAAEMMRHDPTMLLQLYTESRRDLKRKAANL